MNKLRKVWFQSTILVKFHGCSVRCFKYLKQFFLDWFWMTASNVWAEKDNFKHRILTLQYQKVADEKWK